MKIVVIHYTKKLGNKFCTLFNYDDIRTTWVSR